MVRTFLVMLVALGLGCEPNAFDIDRFPIETQAADIPLVELAAGDGAPVPAVVDTASPLTLFDALDGPVQRRRADVTLFGQSPGGDPVLRAEFPSSTVVRRPLAEVGVTGGAFRAHPVGAVLGADILRRYALGLELSSNVFRLAPGLAGSDEHLGRDCTAVFRTPVVGGGRLLVGEAEIEYPATRLVLGGCAGQRVTSLLSRPTGADVLLVVATGTPMTVLSRSAYERAIDASLDPSSLGTVTLFLPGAAAGITAHLGTLDKLAIVGDRITDRGPCEELWTTQHAAIGSCCFEAGGGLGCPCRIDGDNCQAPAVAEVCGDLTVAVVRDTEPFLQALREELRPRFADVDGLLGADILAAFEIDLDYPGGRSMFRCEDELGADIASCRVIPRMDDRQMAADVDSCLPRVESCVALETFPPEVTCVTEAPDTDVRTRSRP